jgi:hypothetical protein
MKKLDLKAQFKHLYNPTAKAVTVVDVPEFRFLRVSGAGGPNAAYEEAVQALYTLAYTLKFMVKMGRLAVDYPVMPLESLWWTDGRGEFHLDDRDNWKWTAMIMQPDLVNEALLKEAREQAEKKKPDVKVGAVELARMREGRAAQVMHIGPYSAEGPTIAAVHRFIAEQGGKPTGKHHEIYLGDPRRTAPHRLKTVIRQPFA